MSTARQRWKRLHRARRLMRRAQDDLLKSIHLYPQGQMRDRAIDRLINPPIVVAGNR